MKLNCIANKLQLFRESLYSFRFRAHLESPNALVMSHWLRIVRATNLEDLSSSGDEVSVIFLVDVEVDLVDRHQFLDDGLQLSQSPLRVLFLADDRDHFLIFLLRTFFDSIYKKYNQ